jgi:hypothetical protein
MGQPYPTQPEECYAGDRPRKSVQGATPIARRKGLPNLPRYACAYLRFAPPFRSSKGGRLPPDAGYNSQLDHRFAMGSQNAHSRACGKMMISRTGFIDG